MVTTECFAVGNLWLMKSVRLQPGYRRAPSQRGRTYFKDWRKFRKIRQEQIAAKLETTKATVSRIERGEMQYTQDYLEALAQLLGVHVATLLSRPPSEADRS